MTENKTKSYSDVKINKAEKSTITIEGSIPSDVWESYKKQAIKNINGSITIDGFRKGMIPENILEAKVGSNAILEEMAELALSRAYMDIVVDNKIEALGKPSVEIKKLALQNPLEFKLTTAVVPEVKLPDYKKISANVIGKSDKKELEVTDKDVEDTILRIRKSYVSHEGHDHDKMSPEEHEKVIMDSLPEFNDEFVRGLGEYENIEDFKKKVRVLIGESKASEAKEKTRIRIADAIDAETEIDLPELFVESELARTEQQFSKDVERMGVKMEDYLKHAKKTIEEVRKEWRPHAEKKARLQLILNAIASKENLRPSNDEIEKEVSHILEHYKEADRESASTYAETVLMNEMVFSFLENNK